MFVLPEFRCLKLGRRILGELESLARASGLEFARLETLSLPKFSREMRTEFPLPRSGF
jgi:GNAT superfamily N-acetyltransferase